MIGIESVNANDVRKVVKAIKQFEPEILKELRADLKSQLVPLANQIASTVPTQPPLRGFANNGPTGWGPVRGKTSFTPGKNRRGGNSLVSIRIDGGNKRGFYITELAGSRSSGATPSGEAMIYRLNQQKAMRGRGGRFAYAQFRFLRPDIVRIATEIVNKNFAKLEKMTD